MLSKFYELAMFALSTMSLPHSNACCERIFSKVNRVKAKPRNKLVTDTVAATIMASECIKNKGCCYNFKPGKEMLDMMTSNNLYPKHIDTACEIEDIVVDEGVNYY